jgi:hypothetical protein
VEIDLVFRHGNQFGLMEVKLKAGKRAIDQLVTVASQTYLGTHVKRFVASTKPLEINNQNLAIAHVVTPIILSHFDVGQRELDDIDRGVLTAAVLTRLNPPPRSQNAP